MRTKILLGFAACVLALLGSAPAGAAVTFEGKAPLPPLVYFEESGELLRVDNRVLSAATSSFLESPDGCVEMPIERAVVSEGIERSESSGREGVVHLGVARDDVLRLTGTDVDSVLWWERVLTQRTCRSAAGMSVTLEAGGDTMSVLVPWGERDPSVVTMNGLSRSGNDYEGLASSVRNPSELARGLVTLASVSSELGSRYSPPIVVPEGSDCFWPCFRCGTAGVGLIVGGTAALVATCGAAVVTAGALTPACVAGGIGYFSGALAVADACLGCDQCLHPKPCPGKPCPAGQHPCYEKSCCRDDDNVSTGD